MPALSDLRGLLNFATRKDPEKLWSVYVERLFNIDAYEVWVGDLTATISGELAAKTLQSQDPDLILLCLRKPPEGKENPVRHESLVLQQTLETVLRPYTDNPACVYLPRLYAVFPDIEEGSTFSNGQCGLVAGLIRAFFIDLAERSKDYLSKKLDDDLKALGRTYDKYLAARRARRRP